MKVNKAFIALALSAMSITSICADTAFGYSTGDGSSRHAVRFNLESKQAIAIKVSAEKAKAFNGKTITGISAQFGDPTGGSDFRFYIAKSLDGDAVATATTTSPKTKWTTYELDSPYVIDGEEFYVIASCYYDNEEKKPFVFDESGDFTHGVAYAYANGKWNDLADLNLQYGAPNLRFVISEDVNHNDIAVKSVVLPGMCKEGENVTFSVELFNFGTTTVTSFDLKCAIGDGESLTFPVEGISLAQNEILKYQVPEFLATQTGILPIKIEVDNVSGVDADITDNIYNGTLSIYGNNVNKRILIEEFTGQWCVNCPRGYLAMTNAIAGKEDQYVVVAHHIGGSGVDYFIMYEAYQYSAFYNNGGSTYAPAFMINRLTPVGSNTPVVGEGDIPAQCTVAENTEAYVGITANSAYNPTTRTATITVDIDVYNAPSTGDNRLNVWITQDGIAGIQAGQGSGYIHNHVFRGSLTGYWGDEIALEQGTRITKVYNYTLPEAIKSTYTGLDESKYLDKIMIPTVLENMNVVAFVSAYGANDANAYPVYNATEIKLNASTSGIDDTIDDNTALDMVVAYDEVVVNGATTIEAYTMQGQLLSTGIDRIKLPMGLYIVKATDANGNSSAKKVVIQ